MASARGRDDDHEFGPPPGNAQRARVEVSADASPTLPMALRTQTTGRIRGAQLQNVSSNVFHITTSSTAQLCLYSVSFSPPIPEEHRKTRQEVFEQAMSQFFQRAPKGEARTSEHGGESLYDSLGSLCMTSKPLLSKVVQDGIHVWISEKRVKKEFHISFKFKKQVDIQNPEDAQLCEQLINNLMRRALDRRANFSAVGNTFMLTDEPFKTNHAIGGGCKLFTAFSLNVRKFIDGLFFVVDITRKPLFEGSIARVMKDIARSHLDPEKRLKECDKRFKKMTVYAAHNKATYKVIGVDVKCRGPKGADGSPGAEQENNAFRTFLKRDKETGERRPISYVDYFRSQFSITLKDADLPLIKCKAVNGKEANVCHIPPELLQEAGWNKELFNRYAKDMLEVCSLEPEERHKDMQRVVRLISSEGDSSAQQTPTAKLLADFGLSISQKPAELKSLSLPAPKCLVMSKQNSETQSDFQGGSPLGNGRNNVLDSGRPINHVVILVPDRDQRRADELWRAWLEVSSGFGTKFPSRPHIIGFGRDFRRAVEDAESHFQKVSSGPQECFIVAMFDASDKALYSELKRKMYSISVASQVCTMGKIVSRKTGNIDKSVITNLCIKALCKIGGVPWGIQQTGDYAGVFSSGGLPVMVIGIDNSCNMKKVSVDRPSPLACVASYTHDACKFFSRRFEHVDGQQHTANINSFLDGAMGAYATANNLHLPKTIIVYRAGLNRSQQVLKEADDYIAELDRMWEVNAPGVEKPCITIIHTSKRSAIRLFQKRGNFVDNCGAGTVIDDNITSANVFDFELVANNTNKIMQRMPTCVPTNYKVLRVRGNCKEGVYDPDLSKGVCDKDWITKLTFALSHLYFCYIRGSCRLPSVLTWANRCAERCGFAEIEPTDSTMQSSLYYS